MKSLNILLVAGLQLSIPVVSAFSLSDLPSKAIAKLQGKLPSLVIISPDKQVPMQKEGDEQVLLSDVLPIEKQISIFSGFTRAVESVSRRLEDGAKNTTVLAPSNTAITNLPRKPWESRDDEEEAGGAAQIMDKLYSGLGGEDRAARNLRRFVEAHLVAQSPWERGKANKIATLEGKKVWWDYEDGVKKVCIDARLLSELTADSYHRYSLTASLSRRRITKLRTARFGSSTA